MATRTISTKIKLDGEKEFKEAMTEINSGLSVLRSELKKVTAEYQDDANSVEALTAKNDVLERTLLSQKEKVEALKEELKKNAQQYGENDERTKQLQSSLNYAEAAVYNTESAIRKNTEAMKEAGETGTGLGTVLDGITSKLGIDLPDGAVKALDSFGSFSTESVLAFGAVATAVAGVVKVMEQLIETAKESAGYVDDFVTTSVQSGIDTYTLQVLDYMEDLADVDYSTVTNSMTKLTKSMGDARDGTASAVEAFEKLQVNIYNTDGSLRDATDVFWECIDSLGEIENSTERDTVAMDVFGKKAQELNTLVAIGSEGFNEFAEEAESVGYILGTKDVEALNGYQDALDKADKLQTAMANQISAELAPGLTKLTEGWSNLKTEGLQLIIDSGIIDFLGDICYWVGELISFVGDMIEVLNALLHPIETLKDLLGIQNTTLEENAEATMNAYSANEYFKESVSEDAAELDATTASANKATTALNSYAAAAAQLSSSQLADIALYADYGWSANEAGTYWYDTWGVRHTADEDPYEYWQKTHPTATYDTSEYADWQKQYLGISNASGNYNFEGGWTRINENGSEMAYLPQGSRIFTAQESESMVGDTYNVSMNIASVKNIDTIDRALRDLRMRKRMRGLA